MEYQPKPNPIEYEPRSPDAQRLDLLVSELQIYERDNLDLKKKDEIVAQMQTLAGQRYVDTVSHLTALARVQEWTGLEVQAIICRRFDFCLYNRLILAAKESKVSYEFDPMFLHISDKVKINGDNLLVGHLPGPLANYDEKKWDLDCIDHKIARIKRQLMKIEKDDKKHGVNGPKKDELRIMLEEQLGKAGKLGDFLSGLEASVKDTMRKLPNSVVVFRPEEIEIVSAVNTWIGRQLGVLVPIENHRFFEYQVDAIVGAVKKTTLPWTFYDTLSHNRLTRIRHRASIVRSENFIGPSEYEL